MIFQNHRVSEARLAKIKNQQPLLLVAYHKDKPIGFKLGYTIAGTARFFSWLGGVHPDFRRQGLAQRMLEIQEAYASKIGSSEIYFTSFEKFPAMIRLGKRNGYRLTRSEMDEGELKFWYAKTLNPTPN